MLRWAELAGDTAPEWVKAVATSIGEARQAATPGDVVHDGLNGDPGYLVVMKGAFTTGRHPLGSRPITGRYVAAVFSAATFRLTDRSVSDREVPLDQYGQVALLATRRQF